MFCSHAILNIQSYKNEEDISNLREWYQIFLDGNEGVVEELNIFYDLLKASRPALTNIGSIYALVNGENLRKLIKMARINLSQILVKLVQLELLFYNLFLNVQRF